MANSSAPPDNADVIDRDQGAAPARHLDPQMLDFEERRHVRPRAPAGRSAGQRTRPFGALPDVARSRRRPATQSTSG